MAGYIPQEIIDQVLDRTDIVALVEQYVTLSKKSSVNYFGLCPFHTETKPSFSVAPGKQIFYCFSCRRGGNAIKFIQEIENLSFPEAVRFLAERANIRIKEDFSPADKARQDQRKALENLHLEAARFFYHTLQSPTGKLARNYLHRRGYSDRTIKSFGLGYADPNWESLSHYLLSKGFSQDQLLASGIIHMSSKQNLIDLFRDRVMIPIFPSHGNYIIAFGGRSLQDGDGPKYINSPETSIYHKGEHLFALNLVRKQRPLPDSLILAEGYMDVIALHQAGYPNAVASLGTALTEKQARLVDRYAHTVFLAYDSDRAGIEAALRAIEMLAPYKLEIKVLNFGPDKDPDNYIKNKGRERLAALIKEAPSALDFQIHLARLESTDDQGKLQINQYSSRISRILAKLDSAVMLEIYAKRIAEEIGVSDKVILHDVKQVVQGKSLPESDQNSTNTWEKSSVEARHKFTSNQPTEPSPKESVALGYELLLLTLLASYPDFIPKVSGRFKADIFSHPACQMLADKLLEAYGQNKLDIQAFLTWCQPDEGIDPAINSGVCQILLSLDEEASRKDQGIVEDTMARVMQNTIKNKQKVLLERLSDKEISEQEKADLINSLSELTKTSREDY